MSCDIQNAISGAVFLYWDALAHVLPTHPEGHVEPGAASLRRSDKGDRRVRGGGGRRVSGNGGRRPAPRSRDTPREGGGLRQEEEEQDDAVAA